jgi:glucosamine--fructose-6-phosphate aminotransferase (isomerizing)
MTRLLQDIRDEPDQLLRCLDHNLGPGRASLDEAARLTRAAHTVFITGIGSSWHAGMAVQSFLHAAGRTASLFDASELLHHVNFPPNCVLIVLSRSGKSVEIVKLLEKCAAAGVSVIAVTNTPDSPLASEAAVVLRLEAAFDHCVSISMYSALALVGALVTAAPVDAPLRELLERARAQMRSWEDRIANSDFLAVDAPYYFLARGASAASAYETRLLWEEAAKAPATAMTTGGFRHGPQEMTARGTRIGIWIDPRVLSAQDIQLARDLRNLGCKTMLIGAGLPDNAADLVLPVPQMAGAEAWQFLVDIMPAQLAAESLARRRGVDPDSFRICSYIIEAEGGLETARK